ncbi:trigger factor [Patescibacteria group bacterium]
MKVQIFNLPKSKTELKVEISPEEFEKFRKEAIKELGKNLKMEGFRPGHVPEEIVEKSLNSEKIMAEAAEKAVKANYRKAVSENNIFPLGQPEIKILKLTLGNSFEFQATVAIMPEIKLPDYKKIASEIKRKEVFVSEKELKDSMAWLQKSRAKFSLKKGGIEKDDFVEIEYSCLQIENGKVYKDAFLIGEGKFLPGFENNLIGVSSGQEKEFKLKFPDDYSQKNFAGKEVTFKTKVTAVQKMELPELGDEFAKNLGKFENIGALEKNVKEGILTEKENLETERTRNEILEKINKDAEMETPEILIESEKARTLQDLKKRVEVQLKVPFDNYLEKIGKKEKELLDSFDDQAKKKVKNSLILREIGKKENIQASEDEIKEEVNRLLTRFPDIKTTKSTFDSEDLKEYTKEVIRNEKTFKLLENLSKK